MNNARPPRGTGAVVSSRPGSHLDTTAPQGQVPAALAPEPALLACLLNADQPTAATILAAIHDEDVADPALRGVLAVARRVVASGAPPQPVLVLADARARGELSTATEVRDGALLLADLAAEVTVVAAWRHYLTAVVQDAVRRRALEAGTRIAQAAEGAPLDTLLDLMVTETAAVHLVAARLGTDTGRAPLRIVQ